VYLDCGQPAVTQTLVPNSVGSVDSYENIPRDFPHPPFDQKRGIDDDGLHPRASLSGPNLSIQFHDQLGMNQFVEYTNPSRRGKCPLRKQPPINLVPFEDIAAEFARESGAERA
jgi:hypothetical protein